MSETILHANSGQAAQNPQKTADNILPGIDINRIIQLIMDVSSGSKTSKTAAKELAKPYLVFAEIFAKDNARDLIEKGMSALGIEALANREFSDSIVKIAEDVASIVNEYTKGKINDKQFVSLMGGSGLKDVGIQVLSALGVHEKMGLNDASDIMKLSAPVLAFTASVAAYKELRQALDDFEAAKERRIQIEAACMESISMIRQYRIEMEGAVSKYLSSHIDTFESAFSGMDQAILDNDVDGYLKGNVEIQEILGYNVQFRNQDEFDALMDSDDTFKL